MRYLTSQKYPAPLKTLLHSRSRSSPSAILFDESSSAATWSSFVAALILSFVARLTDEDWSLSPSARHIPATVRSLKTKTFVILDSPNEVLLSPEILLHRDQIFSFLSDSLKSILDHYKAARKTSKAWIQSNELWEMYQRIKRVVLWEDQLKEMRDWNDGKRQVENGIPKQKLRRWAAIFYSLRFRCGGNRIQ